MSVRLVTSRAVSPRAERWRHSCRRTALSDAAEKRFADDVVKIVQSSYEPRGLSVWRGVLDINTILRKPTDRISEELRVFRTFFIHNAWHWHKRKVRVVTVVHAVRRVRFSAIQNFNRNSGKFSTEAGNLCEKCKILFSCVKGFMVCYIKFIFVPSEAQVLQLPIPCESCYGAR